MPRNVSAAIESHRSHDDGFISTGRGSDVDRFTAVVALLSYIPVYYSAGPRDDDAN